MNQLKIIILSLILTACSFPQFSFKSGGSETKEIDAETKMKLATLWGQYLNLV